MANLSSTGEDSQCCRPFQIWTVLLVGGAFGFAEISPTLHLGQIKDDVEAPGVHAVVGYQKGNTTPSDEGVRGGRIVVSTSTSTAIHGNTLQSGGVITFIPG